MDLRSRGVVTFWIVVLQRSEGLWVWGGRESWTRFCDAGGWVDGGWWIVDSGWREEGQRKVEWLVERVGVLRKWQLIGASLSSLVPDLSLEPVTWMGNRKGEMDRAR